MDLRGTISVVGDLPVLALTGEIDLSSVPTLRDLLLRAAFEHPGMVIAVDLDGVDALDDVGLGVLLGSAARLRQQGGDLVVVANRSRDRLAATGFDRAVRVAAGLAEVRP
jgi:anti-anti-sigma factor